MQAIARIRDAPTWAEVGLVVNDVQGAIWGFAYTDDMIQERRDLQHQLEQAVIEADRRLRPA
jgi:hypothetical protein